MKLVIKENKKYICVFLICIVIMIYEALYDNNIIEIIKRALFEPGYIEFYFANTDTPVSPGTAHTFINLVINSVKYTPLAFDSLIVFGTRIFQLILPLFAVVSGIEFYKYFNTICKFKINSKKNYRKFILKKITINAAKIAFSIFMAYCLYLLVSYCISDFSYNSKTTRDFLLDIIGEEFYGEHIVLYYFLEGAIRFLFMPFIYSCLAQTSVLYFQNIKQVIATPIIYYYLLATIGYGLNMLDHPISIYINPSAIMANGTYANINSILLILFNLVLPLTLSIILIYWRTKNVEI